MRKGFGAGSLRSGLSRTAISPPLAEQWRIAPDSPKLMFAKADLYIRNGRNLDQAKTLLKRYMSCSITPDDPPKSAAAKLLHQVGS